MIKEVPCMECDGKGFIAKFGEYSVWSERCPNCGGTGIVKVPVTNADRIRAMSDEELAWELMVWRCEAVSKHHGVESKYPDTQQTILKWLQQPAVEET